MLTPDSLRGFCCSDRIINRAWWIIGVSGRMIIGLFILLVCLAFSAPFFASLPHEFQNLSGDNAQSNIGRHLPEEIPLSDVQMASGKIYSQIDCSAKWFLITLKPEAAEKWQDAMHAQLEKLSGVGTGFEHIEGVHRTVSAPDLTATSLGKAPKWWNPPPLDFRVTERMSWYRGYDSGYGNLLFSGFDPSTNKLWIFINSEQHRLLWSRGMVPDGDQFILGSRQQ